MHQASTLLWEFAHGDYLLRSLARRTRMRLHCGHAQRSASLPIAAPGASYAVGKLVAPWLRYAKRKDRALHSRVGGASERGCRFAFKTRLFVFHDETLCLAVPFFRPQHRFNRSPVLANVFSGPTSHAVSEPMQPDRAPISEQMPLPCGKPNLAWVAAAVRLGKQHVRPPERRATQRRVV